MLKDFMSKEVVYIGAGSNTGDRAGNIRKALDLLNRMRRVEITAVSSLYETEPVDVKTKDWFINCAAKITTDLSCFELLFVLKEIEMTLGRKMSPKDGSRSIDLDILVWEHRVLGSDALTIPHKSLSKRKFVLLPLNEINSHLMIPKHNKTPKDLLEKLDGVYEKYEVKKLEEKIELESDTLNA